jgi:tetratricopeptide (TPR) repeat protein
LIEHLEADGRLDHTLVIVVGDHGESLGEHREQTHGFFIYDATVRIPLIIAGPGVAHRIVPDQVRIVDVMPTALEVLKVASPAAVQGRSLTPLSRGEHLDLLALSETWYPRYHYGWSELTAIRDGRYKLIAAPRRELYDLQEDPQETRDLSSQNPSRADALERGLREAATKVSSKSAPRTPQPIDPEAEERLRALGYVGASVSARTLEDRPRGDPKDKIVLYNLLKLAAQDSVDGRIDEGIAKVERALTSDPEILEGYTMLGNLHVKAKRYDEAVTAYRKALSLDPGHEGAAFSLALAYKQMGRTSDAEAGFARARTLDPHSGKALWQLADIWMQRGEYQRAETILRDALVMKVDRPSFLVKLGECYIELKRFDEAAARLREALQARPDAAMAHYDLGLIAEAQGRPNDAISEYAAELSRHPQTYRASFNLAKLLMKAGRTHESVSQFRQSVQSNPEFGAGYLYLAKALLDAGDLEASESAARKGIALKPDAQVAPLGHYVLADIYTRMGRPRDAAREAAAGRKLERGG